MRIQPSLEHGALEYLLELCSYVFGVIHIQRSNSDYSKEPVYKMSFIYMYVGIL